MKLNEHQMAFTRDLGLVLVFASTGLGMAASIREVQRTLERQKELFAAGKTKTMNSQHLKSLAADLVLFVNTGTASNPVWALTWDTRYYKELAKFWVDLSPENRWGGDWNKNGRTDDERFIDAVHYERRDKI